MSIDGLYMIMKRNRQNEEKTREPVKYSIKWSKGLKLAFLDQKYLFFFAEFFLSVIGG